MKPYIWWRNVPSNVPSDNQELHTNASSTHAHNVLIQTKLRKAYNIILHSPICKLSKRIKCKIWPQGGSQVIHQNLKAYTKSSKPSHSYSSFNKYISCCLILVCETTSHVIINLSHWSVNVISLIIIKNRNGMIHHFHQFSFLIYFLIYNGLQIHYKILNQNIQVKRSKWRQMVDW